VAYSWGLILFTPINQHNIENYNLPRSTNYEVEEMLGSESNSILDFKSIELEINAFPAGLERAERQWERRNKALASFRTDFS
jgi:hypothetical protein